MGSRAELDTQLEICFRNSFSFERTAKTRGCRTHEQDPE